MIDIELLKQAVMDSRDGITIVDARDADLTLLFANPAFERMTGHDRGELADRPCRYYPLANDETDDAKTGARSDTPLPERIGGEATFPSVRRDGTTFWSEVSLSPLYDCNGELAHYLGIHKDVTQRVLLERELRARTRDLADANAALERLVTLDALTGVYNRRHFDDRLETLWSFATRNADPIALFFIDIDHFKRYNDRYGHAAGDGALVRVATTLSDSFQRGSDLLARYGGEEFVVLASDMARAPAARFAQRLCDRVRDLDITHPGVESGVLTISVGHIVVTPLPDMRPEEALERADRALFEAKARGRDQAVGAATPA